MRIGCVPRPPMLGTVGVMGRSPLRLVVLMCTMVMALVTIMSSTTYPPSLCGVGARISMPIFDSFRVRHHHGGTSSKHHGSINLDSTKTANGNDVNGDDDNEDKESSGNKVSPYSSSILHWFHPAQNSQLVRAIDRDSAQGGNPFLLLKSDNILSPLHPLPLVKNNNKLRHRHTFGIVIVVDDSSDVPGALVLVYSLRLTRTLGDVVVLISADIDDDVRLVLMTLGCVVKRVDTIDRPPLPDQTAEREHSKKKGKEEKGHWTRLSVWNQTEYSRLVFIGTSCLVVNSIDALYDEPELSAVREYHSDRPGTTTHPPQTGARPNARSAEQGLRGSSRFGERPGAHQKGTMAGFNDTMLFNDGVFVLRPHKDTFHQMSRYRRDWSRNKDRHVNNGVTTAMDEQQFLNSFFRTRAAKSIRDEDENDNDDDDDSSQSRSRGRDPLRSKRQRSSGSGGGGTAVDPVFFHELPRSYNVKYLAPIGINTGGAGSLLTAAARERHLQQKQQKQVKQDLKEQQKERQLQQELLEKQQQDLRQQKGKQHEGVVGSAAKDLDQHIGIAFSKAKERAILSREVVNEDHNDIVNESGNLRKDPNRSPSPGNGRDNTRNNGTQPDGYLFDPVHIIHFSQVKPWRVIQRSTSAEHDNIWLWYDTAVKLTLTLQTLCNWAPPISSSSSGSMSSSSVLESPSTILSAKQQQTFRHSLRTTPNPPDIPASLEAVAACCRTHDKFWTIMHNLTANVHHRSTFDPRLGLVNWDDKAWVVLITIVGPVAVFAFVCNFLQIRLIPQRPMRAFNHYQEQLQRQQQQRQHLQRQHLQQQEQQQEQSRDWSYGQVRV
eukprot:TRINITY_DN4924_c2_g2_i1.p1 TRINITY_DN4924_c2_g2~~TRINITY_DN4924_c2_g2_i1.p1  ORF type:complete len:831 (+),score=132.29 TRINITY_DN4924_c2_g2_i1:114-2606(+)